MYPQVFGKYVLERELSRGGMARVALATLRGAGGFEKKLVVKQIRDDLAFDSEFVRRFVEEAKTTVELKHANIVPVYELGVEQGTYFLAMELVEGVSVSELLKFLQKKEGKRVGLSPEQGAYVGSEVCRALDYAHRRMGVVHRDITPRNVMIDEEGQVKLIDFGIAAPAKVAGHEVFGSPGHMPPEQIEGKALGPPTDIFALAVLLMEAWTAVPPFRRATPEDCEAAMLAEHPKPSATDPRLIPLDDAMGRAMSLDPRERQQEAVDLGRALRQFLQGVDTTDVQRALGALVREARIAEPESIAARKIEESIPRQAASYGEIFTKTFAARDEVDHWSKPPATGEGIPTSTRKTEEGDGGVGPSTRRLDSVRPFPTGRTGRGADASSSQGIRAPSSREIAASAPEPVVETIATRPLETPVKRRLPAEEARSKSGRSPAVWIIGGLALAGVAVFAFNQSKATNNGTTGQTTTAQSASSAPKIDDSAKPVTSSTVSMVPSTGPSSTAPPIHTSNTSQTGAAGTSSSAGIGSRAELAWIGTVGTRVSINGGASRGCPGRGTFDPGQYEVRFFFDPTGESKGTRLTVRAGEHVTLRGDFTGATPNIVILH